MVEQCVVIVTVSDTASEGNREDVSGDTAQRLLEVAGMNVLNRLVVPDNRERISTLLRTLCGRAEVSCIVTTGGTGVGPRDVTPEATLDVIDRTLPGMAEAMRQESLKKTPFAMISRQVVGVRGRTLIVNLPGSPRAVAECLAIILPVLPHTLRLLAGHTAHDGTL